MIQAFKKTIRLAAMLLLVPTLAQAGWLGVTVEELVGAKAGMGKVRVMEVIPGSPAARGGLAPGDIITRFDGEVVDETGALAREVRRSESGRAVEVEVVRGDRTRTLRITPEDPPGDEPSAEVEVMRAPVPPIFLRPGAGKMSRRGWLGVELMPLSPALKEHFGVERGLLVSSVMPDSPAEKSGLQAGDIIQAADGESLETMAQLQKMVTSRSKGDTLALQIRRDGRREEVEAVLEEKEAEVMLFSMRTPDKNWTVEFDADDYRQALQTYKEALERNLKDQKGQEAYAEVLKKQLQELQTSLEVLSGDDALRRLLDNRAGLQNLLGEESIDAQDCRRELESQQRRLREMQRDLRARDARLRDLESRLRSLERENRDR